MQIITGQSERYLVTQRANSDVRAQRANSDVRQIPMSVGDTPTLTVVAYRQGALPFPHEGPFMDKIVCSMDRRVNTS